MRRVLLRGVCGGDRSACGCASGGVCGCIERIGKM